MKIKVMLQIDLYNDLGLYNWLKSLMQNPIYEDESAEEEEYRTKLFHALSRVSPSIPKPKPTNNWVPDEDDIPF
jgi:hypothetical protein